uniref:Uncharacterized protein n=1 Tax=Arundo donax TaxID=35708 RepID=A0A0A9BD31_ARUDO
MKRQLCLCVNPKQDRRLRITILLSGDGWWFLKCSAA